jgi:succinate-semialdehyde dehydrogenase/glutarate-semialdehyde dehydrogenase
MNMSFTATDPTNGKELLHYPAIAPDAVEPIIERGHAAHLAWRSWSPTDRAARLRKLADLLLKRRHVYAALMTTEMGKPVTQALSEIEKSAHMCQYYAEHAEAFLAPEPVETDARTSYWAYRPLGVVLGIMPWNYPFWQVLRFAAPTLAAGNGVLVKHAPNVPGCAEALETLFDDAGSPPGIYANLFVDLDTVGRVIDHPLVRAVSLTGSVRAGRSVAGRAGSAIKKCVLELGGSDPSVVLSDADLDAAVSSCATGRLLNSGQSCVAAKRFVVVDDVCDLFQDKLIARMAAVTVGDPMDPATELGPLARIDLRDSLHDQVTRSVEAGARLVLGGEVPQRPGAWYPATILTDVVPGMPAYEEELFGPVAAIIRVADEAEAIRVANDTIFGLGAAVYTADVARGEMIAADLLDAGNCFVNGIVRSDPRLPFGGTKQSGYGRELGPFGLREFTNVKTVWVN